MFAKPKGSSGLPIYLQLAEQVKQLVQSGALRPGEQLPGIRKIAEELVMNPNTVAKAYRQLEQDGIVQLRHGTGAFIREDVRLAQNAETVTESRPLVDKLILSLRERGLGEGEIRRLFDAALQDSFWAATDA